MIALALISSFLTEHKVKGFNPYPAIYDHGFILQCVQQRSACTCAALSLYK